MTTVRWLWRLLVVVVVALLGLSITSGPVLAARPSTTQIYTYHCYHRAAAVTEVMTERCPPASASPVTFHKTDGPTPSRAYDDTRHALGQLGRDATSARAHARQAAEHPLSLGQPCVAAQTAERSCSFSGATTVLMADGTRKPIEDIEVGDKVIATDPETGEQLAKSVEHVWVHDDTVTDLVVDGEVITTTEDHPFWSDTDQRFERADALSAGEKVLGADGRMVTVSGPKVGTTREALAYNLTVAGIHTYHVGRSEILVHNTCSIFAGGSLNGRSMIGTRADLFGAGFKQGLAQNKKGYLFTNGTGAEVRIMRRDGGWDARVKNEFGNYLDELGNVPQDASSAHGIRVFSR